MNTLVPPTDGSIALNACDSSPMNGIVSYRWTFSDGTPAVSTRGCQTSFVRTLSHTWHEINVSLTISSRVGKVASTRRLLRFRDLVVASLGDSAASGEGAPDNFSANKHAYAADRTCDRSGRAASAQAALQLQSLDPHTSITFWHLACSGATITADAPTDFKHGGLLTPYNGQHYFGGPPIQPQVDRVQQLSQQAGRPVDAMLLTIGANDLRWADVATECYYPYIGVLCITHANEIRHRMQLLPSRYNALRVQLSKLTYTTSGASHSVITADHVYITQYFDPVHDPGGISFFCPHDFVAPSQAVRMWGADTVEAPLDAAVHAAATQNRWRLIDGIAVAFHDHGDCAWPGNAWVNSPADSLLSQGNIDGTWHPNSIGQRVIANFITKRLSNAFNEAGYTCRPTCPPPPGR